MRIQYLIAMAALCAVGASFAAEPTTSAAATSSAATEGPAVNTSLGGPTNANSAPQKSTPPTAASSAKPSSSTAANPKRSDRLDLETTVVTGNRELPKVLYIVPWKKSDIGDLPAQPFNTLLDEVLTPVDRDVFRREVTYYGAVSSGANAGSPAAQAPAPGTEK
ncbi:MAG TPA: hypothetical protein VFS24_05120 [Steroidobacteraceae bacterium]|nr:hypothetical protein [Steroidobacteraceae bacterium]